MNRISHLIFRRIIGVITPEEEAELNQWESLSPENRRFAEKVADPDELEKWFYRQRAISSDRVEYNVKRHISSLNKHIYFKRALTAAAAIAILLIGLVMWNRPDIYSPSLEIAQNTITSIEDIQHGTQKAVLTTTAGQMIPLTNIASVSSAAVSNSLSKWEQAQTSNQNFEQLCIETPRGGEFKVVLDDSTQVWLNANSKLYFPESFNEKERRVSIEGEAYFEVAKDSSRPFIVESNGQRIQVYGTRFNVRCYADDPITYTTLEEGSISLTTTAAASGEIFLVPGKQARFSGVDTEFKIQDVNTETVSSWRKGYFVFENQTLLNIMRDLSRWYNFDFEFESPEIANELFMGAFPRDSEFATAIRILETSGSFNTSVENGKVIIKAHK